MKTIVTLTSPVTFLGFDIDESLSWNNQTRPLAKALKN